MDEDLRRREREASAGGADAAACLAAGQALLRGGRRDEAFQALVPARDDPAVRALLAELPAWTHPDACAGRTRWVDVPPLRWGPVLRWRTDLRHGQGLLAGPLGVVVNGPRGYSVLDLQDGEPQDERAGPGARGFLPGEVLAWAGTRLLVRTGGRVRLVEPPGREGPPGPELAGLEQHSLAALCGPGGVVVLDAARGRVRAWRAVEDRFALAWERARPPGQDLVLGGGLVAGGGLVVVQLTGESLRVLDLTSGEDRFAAGRATALVDAAGVVASGPGGRVIAFDPSGAVRWSAPGLQMPVALAPGVVVAWDEGIRLVVLDRESGAERVRLPVTADGVAAARDALYWWRNEPHPCLGLVGLDGGSLWELDLRGDPPRQVVPYPGRFLLLTRRGDVLCYEQGA